MAAMTAGKRLLKMCRRAHRAGRAAAGRAKWLCLEAGDYTDRSARRFPGAYVNGTTGEPCFGRTRG
jgi:hypothetical protein